MSVNGRPTETDSAAAAQEIAVQAAGLARLASEHRLDTLTYLLDMVVLESRQVATGAGAASAGRRSGRPESGQAMAEAVR